MGKMKELYIEQLKEKNSFQTLYPDQQSMMNNEQCVNCLSFHTTPIDKSTHRCDECGITMIETNNELRLS